MKVAYCIRSNNYVGGDMVQAVKTKDYLHQLGKDISVVIIDSASKLDSTYDIAHIFNFSTEEVTNSYFEKALALGIPIVSSPIYWDYSYAQPSLPSYLWVKGFISKYTMNFGRFMNSCISLIPSKKTQTFSFNISPRFKKNMNYYIENSRLILPNSIEEGNLCYKFSGYPNSKLDKIRVVLNGVDITGVTILNKDKFKDKYNIPDNYILQVGRIEYAKNQINLITSMMIQPDIPIVLLGTWDDTSRYFKRVKAASDKRGNVYFVKNVPHEEVYSFYYYAKTHVSLSFRESPGLVNLESLSQKCPIVIPDQRFLPVDTYFGNNESVEVVNPFDKKNIVESIMKSYKKPHNTVDLSNLTWLEIAKDTYNVYLEIIESNH